MILNLGGFWYEMEVAQVQSGGARRQSLWQLAHVAEQRARHRILMPRE